MAKYLLASNHLFGWTGSELTLATVGGVLREAGHQVLVYAPYWSRANAPELFLNGLPATQRLADVAGFAPEAAYTQHHPVATVVRSRLPGCPIAHALLGVIPYLERPPPLELGVQTFLPISEETRAKLQAARPVPRVRLFRNLVDDRIFVPDADPAAGALKTVACYSYKLDPARLQALQTATAAVGAKLRTDTLTLPGKTPYCEAPQRVRAGQVVVASGRGAIEAMLCGRVPLIMADCGDDGLVTPANFSRLMSTNFSGRTRGGRLDATELADELARYRADDVPALTALARQHFGVTARRQPLLDLFAELASAGPPALSPEQVAAIEFEAEGQELQRQFARQASDAQRRAQAEDAALAATGSVDWQAVLKQGHAAWKAGTELAAFQAYLQAFSLHTGPTPARSLASLALMQLADREHAHRNPKGRRAALQAFVAINPDNGWAKAQLAAGDPGAS
jgi:hypothetical protein